VLKALYPNILKREDSLRVLKKTAQIPPVIENLFIHFRNG